MSDSLKNASDLDKFELLKQYERAKQGLLELKLSQAKFQAQIEKGKESIKIQEKAIQDLKDQLGDELESIREMLMSL